MYLGEFGFVTLTATLTPLYFCECINEDKFILSLNTKICIICLTKPKRASLEEGKIITL